MIFNMEEHNGWQPPEWWFTGSRPTSDDCYFENMSRVIFQAGLNWRVIDTKWPRIKEAFEDFKISKVVKFTSADVQRLLTDEGIIRHKGKIQAVIYNAQGFEAIHKQFGSFQKYIDSQDKSDNYKRVVDDLVGKFKWLGKPSATTYLYTVGEKINVWE
jgi:3-methyladenine DNA glycosylase Tag